MRDISKDGDDLLDSNAMQTRRQIHTAHSNQLARKAWLTGDV